MKRLFILSTILISLEINSLPAFWDLITYPQTKKEHTILAEDVVDCLLTQEQQSDYEIIDNWIGSWAEVSWKLKNKNKKEVVCFKKHFEPGWADEKTDVTKVVSGKMRAVYMDSNKGYNIKTTIARGGERDCLFYMEFTPKEEYNKPFTHVARWIDVKDHIFEIRVEEDEMTPDQRDLWLGIMENHEVFNKLSLEKKLVANEIKQ